MNQSTQKHTFPAADAGPSTAFIVNNEVEKLLEIIKQAKTKVENLRQTVAPEKQSALDDAEMGLEWVARKIEQLKRTAYIAG